MNTKAYLLDDDRGVSPVIGVILMVAITVILAAVIATFVMNMGPSENTTPSASFDIEQDSSGTGYDLVHDGGEAIPYSEISSETTVGSSDVSSSSASWGSTSGDFTASDIVIDGISSGTDVTVVWQNPDSGDTQILFEGTAP